MQKRLGCAKPSITPNTYTHLRPDKEDTTRAAAEACLQQYALDMPSLGTRLQHCRGRENNVKCY